MRVFIPSSGRQSIISSNVLFPEATIVLHSEEDRERYIAAGRVDAERIVVSGQERNLSKQRNWILDNLVQEDEWIVMADDNLQRVTATIPLYYALDRLSEAQAKETEEVTQELLKTILSELQGKAEEEGARLAGFRTTDNPFFGRKKWGLGFVRGKMYIMKKSEVRHDETFSVMTDWEFTCKHLLNDGKTLVNKYVFPFGPHYQEGGIGSLESRVPERRKNCVRLMQRYPGLLLYNEKKNMPTGSDVQLRFNSAEQMDKWRWWMLSTKR